MLFNTSMAWLDNDCSDPVPDLTEAMISTIYFEE